MKSTIDKLQPVAAALARPLRTALAVLILAVACPPALLAEAPPRIPDEDSGRVEPIAAEAPIPTRNLWSIVRDGGPLMIPIAACSMVLLAVAFERMISLRRGRVVPRPFVSRFVQQVEEGQLTPSEALELCRQNGSPVAEIFAAAVCRWGRPAVEVEQAILDAGQRATHGLRRYLRVLHGIATVSPLLGLLGTVLGMIHAFNAIATSDAMGRPELLANGISQALLTTAAGLSVAIPALILYMYYVSRADRLIVEMDRLGQQLVHLIASDAIRPADNGRTGKSSRKTRREHAA